MSALALISAALPAGDPRRPFWTYADLAAVFALHVRHVKGRMPRWEAAGFPAPLPWSLHAKRWNPAAVLAWKAREERRVGARPLELRAVAGGVS